MSRVFVVDTTYQPLSPIHPGQARLLLKRGQAAIFRRFPFTLILKQAAEPAAPVPLRLKIDPGSKTTGLAIVDDTSGQVLFAAEVTHRGQQVRDRLFSRRAQRRSRRSRHTRYRTPRFLNRRRRAGWLPPSLESRIANVTTWVARLSRFCPIGAISQELVKFDTQAMQHPEIAGVEYQQGTLAAYELREYLLEKWNRRCAYCKATNVPLQIEHIIPRARGGSDRVSNLTLACNSCNQAKSTQTAAEFGHPQVQAQARLPLKDATAINASRWALYERLRATGLPVEIGTGGRTKWNRTTRGLPKAHWIDAACVGASTPAQLFTAGVRVLAIKAAGHGTRQMCQTDRYGFPIRHRARQKHYFGFQTGDMVRAIVPSGLNAAGLHVGRVTVRAKGYFRIGSMDGIPARTCCLLQRHDGYAYGLGNVSEATSQGEVI